MWQFVEAVEGLADACRALDIPITGGNVSLYNETDGQAIFPTPVIGVVGLIEDANRVVSRTFKQQGDTVVLLGDSYGELGGSRVSSRSCTASCRASRRAEPRTGTSADCAADPRGGAKASSQSAHDCSDGGLAITLAECAFDTGGIGLKVDAPDDRERSRDPFRRIGLTRRRVGDGGESSRLRATGARIGRADADNWCAPAVSG